MAKIITAIIEENILKKINKNKITENKNILYKEAILDTLKKNKKVDIIIISEKIPGEINLIKLIKKIKNINKKIKIIIILYNKKIEKELIKNNIKDIYYNNILSINKLIKKLEENNYIKNNNLKIKNKKIINIIIKIINNKIKNNVIIKKINNELLAKEKNKNKVICIFGENLIDRKIIELIIIKKLLIKKNKIIIINLKINNRKIKEKNKKIIRINKRKNKYYLQLKINNKLKEKIINKNILEIININKILKTENRLVGIKILKNLIKKYNKKNYYVVFNIENMNKNINTKELYIQNKNINIIVAENNKKNLLELNIYKMKNRKTNLIILNYQKNNFSKYFYKINLKNKFNKIKIIDI